MEYSKRKPGRNTTMQCPSGTQTFDSTEATIEHGKNMGAAAGACLKDGGPLPILYMFSERSLQRMSTRMSRRTDPMI